MSQPAKRAEVSAALESLRAAEHEVTRILAEADTFAEAAPRILPAIGARLPWAHGGAWAVDPDGRAIRCVAFWHAPGVEAPELERTSLGLSLASGRGLPGRVWASGEPTWLTDLASEAEFVRAAVASRAGLRSAVVVPLKSGSQTLGCLEFFSHEPREPDANLLWMLGAVGAVLGQFLDRRRGEHALRAAEERLRYIVSSSPAVLCVLRVEGDTMTPTWVSDNMSQLLGYTAAEATAADWWAERLHPEDREWVFARIPDLFARGEMTRDYRFRHRDGSYRWIRDVQRLLRDSQGRPVEVVASWWDISERKRAEHLLQASERQLSSIYDNVADVIYYLAVEPGEQYRFLSANQAFFTTTGLSDDQVRGKLARNLIPEPSLSLVLERYREAIQTRKTVRWEETTAYPAGLKTGEVSVTPIFDSAGRCTHLAGTVHDITERNRVEVERARLSQAVEQVAESIVVTDPAGVVLYVNPAFERISGYSRAEIVGRKPAILRSGTHDAAFYQDMWATLLRGKGWQGRFVNRRKDGTLYEEEATISPVRDAAGTVTTYVSVQRDLTGERRLEDQLRQAQKMEAIGQLAGGVAHDFNNLLGVITGFSELISRDLGAQHPAHARLAQVLKAADRAATLTRQLLAFSRKQVLQPKVLDLNATLEEVEKMLHRLIGEHIQLITVFGPGLGRVHADPGQLEQIVVNLAVNARDAMPDGGKLIIETRNAVLDESYARGHADVQPGPFVMLSVSDTGQGMDQQVLAHIFEPFFTTKGPGKGTGLGLATVYGIVKQSGGHLAVYSEPGRGTTFKIYLPRTEAQSDRAVAQSGEPPPRGTETILLAEDAEALRLMVREILEGSGYRVLEAASPEEVLAAARAHPGEVHVLLTDVVMPRISGPELAAQLLALRPGAKVLYMSGYTDEAIGRHGLLEPGTNFLQKPFAADALLWKLRELLDAERSGQLGS